MAVSNLSQLKQINNHTKITVFGYVRQVHRALSLPHIPPEISYLCLSYYYHNEYFVKSGDEVKISEDKMSIKRIKGEKNYRNTTYCNTWIESTSNKIGKWTFKINGYYEEDVDMWADIVYICFVSNYDDKVNDDCNLSASKYAPNYGFNPTRSVDVAIYDTINNTAESVMDDLIDIRKQFTVILNLKQKTIGYQYDSNDEIRNIIKNIEIGNDIKYKLAVNIWMEPCGISLIDFDLK